MALTKVSYSMIQNNVLSVVDYGADPTGINDSTAAIQAAIDAANNNQTIYLPAGAYKVTASIDLTGHEGIRLAGAGQRATQIVSTADAPVIKIAGSSTSVTNSTGVCDMTIRGSGNSNTSAHGVSFAWVNSCYLQNLVFFSCRHAMNFEHNFQTDVNNIRVYGTGADQSYIGVYMAETTLTHIDNAISANNINVQSVSGYGFRIINGQGSKFVNCEAGGNPMIHAWYIGDPTTGTTKCQWLHLSNCLGDSTVSATWLLRRGTASVLSQMQFDNCWAGNGTQGFFIDACKNIVFNNCQAIGHAGSGITLNQSEQIVINGWNFMENNEDNDPAIADVQIQGGQYNIVADSTMESNPVGKSLIESNATNSNTIYGNNLFQGATIIGANSQVFRNRGFKTEALAEVDILAAATSVTVTHGLKVTPPLAAISVTPKSGLGLAKSFWISNVTATTFVINVDAAPGVNIGFCWNISLSTIQS